MTKVRSTDSTSFIQLLSKDNDASNCCEAVAMWTRLKNRLRLDIEVESIQPAGEQSSSHAGKKARLMSDCHAGTTIFVDLAPEIPKATSNLVKFCAYFG